MGCHAPRDTLTLLKTEIVSFSDGGSATTAFKMFSMVTDLMLIIALLGLLLLTSVVSYVCISKFSDYDLEPEEEEDEEEVEMAEQVCSPRKKKKLVTTVENNHHAASNHGEFY